MHDLEFVGDYRNPQQLTARQRELGFDGTSAGEFSFDDFLDMINPLQHIPVVSTLYRAITGDEISPHARIFGDTLFGGPTGFLTAAATALYEEVAGEDIGEAVLALFTDAPPGDDPQFAETLSAPVAPGVAPLDAAMVAPAGEPGPPLTTAAGPAAAAPEAVADPAAPVPEARLPATGGPGMLTGQDALSALFNDLRGGPSGPRPLPRTEARESLPLPGRQAAAEMKSYPLPPRPPGGAAQSAAGPTPGTPMPATAKSEAAAAHPLIFAQNAAEADIAAHMMQALDKYAAMTRDRRHDQPRPAEKTSWQSDPVYGAGDS